MKCEGLSDVESGVTRVLPVLHLDGKSSLSSRKYKLGMFFLNPNPRGISFGRRHTPKALVKGAGLESSFKARLFICAHCLFTSQVGLSKENLAEILNQGTHGW